MRNTSPLRRLLGWITTPLFIVATLLTLIVWHPVIIATRHLTPRLHGWQVGCANGFLLVLLKIVGLRIVFERLGDDAPPGGAVIVSNHQSLYDIPIILWSFRHRFPRFVAKHELKRGFPSVSNVLREDGSALIDRSNPRQAVDAIKTLGQRVTARGWTACIFPEGTRSRDGTFKRFKPAGLLALLAASPGAPVIPVSINGSWEIMRHGFLPVPFGVRIRVRIHPPESRDGDDAALIERVEAIVRDDLAPGTAAG